MSQAEIITPGLLANNNKQLLHRNNECFFSSRGTKRKLSQPRGRWWFLMDVRWLLLLGPKSSIVSYFRRRFVLCCGKATLSHTAAPLLINKVWIIDKGGGGGGCERVEFVCRDYYAAAARFCAVTQKSWWLLRPQREWDQASTPRPKIWRASDTSMSKMWSTFRAVETFCANIDWWVTKKGFVLPGNCSNWK